MPDPENSEGSAAVGAKVSPHVKKRVQEIAHEKTKPGVSRVTESDVVRDALHLYIEFYGLDEGPTADPQNRGTIEAGEP